MSTQYRVREIITPVNTFTPEFSNDGGQTWSPINSTTFLTKSLAEFAIKEFIKNGSGIKEIIHQYNSNNREILHD